MHEYEQTCNTMSLRLIQSLKGHCAAHAVLWAQGNCPTTHLPHPTCYMIGLCVGMYVFLMLVSLLLVWWYATSSSCPCTKRLHSRAHLRHLGGQRIVKLRNLWCPATHDATNMKIPVHVCCILHVNNDATNMNRYATNIDDQKPYSDATNTNAIHRCTNMKITVWT